MDKSEYTGLLHSVTMLAMFWRHVTLALSSVDVVLKPTLARAGRIARGLQPEVEIFSRVYEPDFARPLTRREPLEGCIAARVVLPERALFGHTAEHALDALACDVMVVKPERFQSAVSVKRRSLGVAGQSMVRGGTFRRR